jgi:hypothetical protein
MHRFTGCCLALAAMLGLAATGHAQTTQTAHSITLTQPKTSQVTPSRTVITMEAAGDLRGLLTLTIDRTADGVSGEWALVVKHLQDVDAAGAPTAPNFDESQGEPAERIGIVDLGTLGGSISAATLSTTADGAIAGIDGLQLTVATGSLTFQGATGAGWANVSTLLSASTGTLTLTF